MFRKRRVGNCLYPPAIYNDSNQWFVDIDLVRRYQVFIYLRGDIVEKENSFRCIDEYLVVQRSINDDFLPGALEFPGGNIEDNELILEALDREIKEEIGINITGLDKKLVHFYDEIKEKNEKYHYIELDFLIEVHDKNLNVILSDEHEKFMWVKKYSTLIDDFIKSKIESL